VGDLILRCVSYTVRLNFITRHLLPRKSTSTRRSVCEAAQVFRLQIQRVFPFRAGCPDRIQDFNTFKLILRFSQFMWALWSLHQTESTTDTPLHHHIILHFPESHVPPSVLITVVVVSIRLPTLHGRRRSQLVYHLVVLTFNPSLVTLFL